MTKIQAIIFAIGAISVVLGVWCLTLSIQNEKLSKQRNKERSKGGEK
jgi:hypothetical protein